MPTDKTLSDKLRDSLLPRDSFMPMTAEEIISCFCENIGCDKFKDVEALAVHPQTMEALKGHADVITDPPSLRSLPLVINANVPIGLIWPLP